MLERLLNTDGRVSFGKWSFACGILACLAFFAVSYIIRAGLLLGGKVLSAMNQLGMVRHERSYIAELTPNGVFAVNDANAVVWLTCLAFILAALGVGLALYAEYKRESTLYASAGFMVATLGIGLLYPLVMVAVQAAGAVALIVIRQYRARTGPAASPDENAGFLASGR